MTFLPIVARELRAAARRPGTHWLRLVTVTTVILIVFILVIAAGPHTQPAELSQSIFLATGIMGLGLALFAGAFLTAPSLSAERQEGTLGLLFLADLRGYDIVLGKLAASSVSAVLGLLAMVPVLGLPLMMGGVTGGEFVRLAVALMGTLYFSLCVGMFLSALNRETRNAMAGTLGLLVFVAGILPTLWWILYAAFGTKSFGPLLLWPSPAYLFWAVFEQNFSSPETETGFIVSNLWLLFAGTMLLAAACQVLPRHLREVPQLPGPSSPSSRAKKNYAWRGGPDRSARWLTPVHWLAIRRSKPLRYSWWALLLVGGITLIGCVIVWARKDEGAGLLISFLSAYGFHIALKCLVVIEAGRRLHEDRANGALELLLTTPLRSPDIIQAQRQYLGVIFRWPIRLAVLLNIILILQMAGNNFGMDATDRVIFLTMYCCGLALLVTDYHTLVWVGMYESLRRRRHHIAVILTLAKVMGGPWLGTFLFVLLAMSGVFDPGSVLGVVTLWTMCSLGLNAVWCVKARHHLQQDFRDLAAELPQTRKPVAA